MKILFKNTTKYTKENYNAFIEFHQNKYGVKTLIKIGLIFLCLIYIVFLNIIKGNWKLILILLVFGGLIYIFNNLRIQKQTNNNKKTIKKQREFTFYFYEKYIKIKCGRKFDRIKYFELYKIFETKEYFFLYTDEEHSLIISKDGFEIGTSKEFAEFIRRKKPLKYKKEKYKEI